MASEREFVQTFMDQALAQIDALEAYRTYQGSDPEYRQRAEMCLRTAMVACRARASEVHAQELHRLVDAVPPRVEMSSGNIEVPALPVGRKSRRTRPNGRAGG